MARERRSGRAHICKQVARRQRERSRDGRGRPALAVRRAPRATAARGVRLRCRRGRRQLRQKLEGALGEE
eukprot:6968058-Prymnesium_polylepis.1